jgi:hypothetical protein
MYDLAGFYLPDDAIAGAPIIRPASGAYEIITHFLAPGALRSDSTSPSSITLTVYAVRDNERCLLANALPYKTAAWKRYTVGQIGYVVDPRLVFDSTKARRAVAFVDSLASAFDVPALGPLEYYVTSNVDVAMDILGVDVPVKYGPHGGFSKPVNHQTFSGIPSLGENYRHELTHLVLSPLFMGHTTTILASEGVATWLGGTSGSDFPTAARERSPRSYRLAQRQTIFAYHWSGCSDVPGQKLFRIGGPP